MALWAASSADVSAEDPCRPSNLRERRLAPWVRERWKYPRTERRSGSLSRRPSCSFPGGFAVVATGVMPSSIEAHRLGDVWETQRHSGERLRRVAASGGPCFWQLQNARLKRRRVAGQAREDDRAVSCAVAMQTTAQTAAAASDGQAGQKTGQDDEGSGRAVRGAAVPGR